MVPLILTLGVAAAATDPVVTTIMSVTPSGPGQALARYLENAAADDPWARPNTVLLDIEASLPRRAEQGHLRAVRNWADNQEPDYHVIMIDGAAMIKQQVIARYLNAEKEAAAIPAATVALTPANYNFRYVESRDGSVYVFHISPKKKRPGLINGELWIDRVTGLAVHEAGYLVKKPSPFIKRLRITHDVGVRNGAPYMRTTHLDIDVRFIGRAQLTIVESPCSELVSESEVHTCSNSQ
jgi:hypothetical protein